MITSRDCNTDISIAKLEMIFIFIFVILINNTISYYNIRHQNHHHRMIDVRLYSNSNSNSNKKLEIALKVKRLKQIQKEGKGYKDYLDEQRKYDVINKINNNNNNNDNDVTQAVNITEKMKQMEKVINYKNKLSANVNNNDEDNKEEILTTQRICFLPDVGMSNQNIRFFYKNLATKGLIINNNSSSPSLIDFIDMPDITELNTKRYEQTWMNYMRDMNLNEKYDIIIAHGTSADALARYLESEKLKFTIFLDVADIYTGNHYSCDNYFYDCYSYYILNLTQLVNVMVEHTYIHV